MHGPPESDPLPTFLGGGCNSRVLPSVRPKHIFGPLRVSQSVVLRGMEKHRAQLIICCLTLLLCSRLRVCHRVCCSVIHLGFHRQDRARCTTWPLDISSTTRPPPTLGPREPPEGFRWALARNAAQILNVSRPGKRHYCAC